MNYEDLRALQRRERNTQRLAEITPDFYSTLSALVNEYKSKYEKSQSPQDVRDLDNICKIAKDIFERREQKIFLKALRDSKITEFDTENMLSDEKNFYEMLLNSVKCNKSGFENVIEGKLEERKEEVAKENIPISEDLNSVLVKITSEVPKFVSGNLEELGPFKSSEIVKLQKKDADVLLSRNFAELI